MTPSSSARPTAWDVVGVGGNSVDFVNLLPAVPQPQGPNAEMRIRKQISFCGGQDDHRDGGLRARSGCARNTRRHRHR